MTDVQPAFLVVGQINKVHGIKGEVFIWPLTDRPDATFRVGARFRVAAERGGGRWGGEAPDEDLPPLVAAAVRPFQKGFLVAFEGVATRNDAEELRGRYLLKPFEEVEPLHPDEVFYHQLLGSRVETVDGTVVGTVQEVFSLEPTDLLEVRTGDRTILIPFTRHVVVHVDREGKRLRIDPPDGLLDL